MRKRQYCIVVNGCPSSHKTIQYSYHPIKDIELSLSKNKALVRFVSALQVNPCQLFARNNVFSDAVSKACVLHILRFGKPLDMKSIAITADGEEIFAAPTEESLPLEYVFGKWKTPTIVCDCYEDAARYYASFPRSRQGHLHAAIHAYFLSKPQCDEVVRFAYLWMAVNGMYSHLWQCFEAAAAQVGKTPSKSDEILKIELMHAYLNSSEKPSGSWSREKRLKVNSKLHGALAKASQELSLDNLQPIEDILRKEDVPCYMTARTYIALELGYQLRCELFHGGKPIRLCVLKGDYETARYWLVNQLLTDIVEKNLFMWTAREGKENSLQREVIRFVDMLPKSFFK